MKKLILIFFVSFTLFACGGKQEEIKYYNRMVHVSDEEANDFIQTLPLFLRLTQEIKEGLDQRKNEEELYKDYIKKLSSDQRFQSSVLEGRFKDMEHYMLVSFNIFQAHSYIKKMGTNYQRVMKETYGSLKKKGEELKELSKAPDMDTNVVFFKKAGLENEFTLYSNIVVIHPYTRDIDTIQIGNQ